MTSSTSPTQWSSARHAGFSLVEMMIAMTLGLFLLIGITYSYLATRDAYRSEEVVARMQEAGRLAFEYLSRDMRMAGYMGCSRGQGFAATQQIASTGDACGIPGSLGDALYNTLSDTTTFNYSPSLAIRGVDSATTALSNGVVPRAGTDVVTVSGAEPVLSVKSGTATELTVREDPSALLGEVLIAADCGGGGIVFRACAVDNVTKTIAHEKDENGSCSGLTNRCTQWGKLFQDGDLLRAIYNTYYIATGANGEPSLFRINARGETEELVPGVENIQLTYGVAQSAEKYPCGYYTATEVESGGTCGSGAGTPKWDLVKSIRVEILVRSADANASTTEQKVWFGGQKQDFDDKRLRLVMTTTIGARNRLLLSTDS